MAKKTGIAGAAIAALVIAGGGLGFAAFATFTHMGEGKPVVAAKQPVSTMKKSDYYARSSSSSTSSGRRRSGGAYYYGTRSSGRRSYGGGGYSGGK